MAAMQLSEAKRQMLKALKKFISMYRHGEAQIPIALEAIHYLQQQKSERENFKWIKNKEQERMI